MRTATVKGKVVMMESGSVMAREQNGSYHPVLNPEAIPDDMKPLSSREAKFTKVVKNDPVTVLDVWDG